MRNALVRVLGIGLIGQAIFLDFPVEQREIDASQRSNMKSHPLPSCVPCETADGAELQPKSHHFIISYPMRRGRGNGSNCTASWLQIRFRNICRFHVPRQHEGAFSTVLLIIFCQTLEK